MNGSTQSGATVQIYQNNETIAQKWKSVYIGSDYFVIRPMNNLANALAVENSSESLRGKYE
jgi:hypothetical protein